MPDYLEKCKTTLGKMSDDMITSFYYLHRAVFEEFLDIISHTRSSHTLRVRATDITARQSVEGRGRGLLVSE